MATRDPFTIYFLMVDRPVVGWTRVGTYYREKANAKGWVSFVRKAWNGCSVRVRPCKITFNDDGTVSERSRNQLDTVFNCDVTIKGKAVTK